MRGTVALMCIILLAAPSCLADTIEVIDLLHLDAREFAASLSGSPGSVGNALAAEAADFAVAAMHHVAQRATTRTGSMQPQTFSRGRSVTGGGADLSHLLPGGLAAPPMAAPNRNGLVVRGEPEAIDELRELIAMLDVPTPMVNVEVAMDEVSTARSRQIDPSLQAWGWSGDLSLGRLGEPVLGFRLDDLHAVLGYGAGWTQRAVTTAANVTGMSGQPMVISAGEARPRIAGEVYYDPWGRRRVEYYTEAVFVGVTFWVLPTVHADDTVTMVLRPVLSEVAGPAAQVGAGDVIQRTLVETTVRVPSGRSLVIGGLDRRLDELSRSFPASMGKMRTDNSSVITVTPTIVRMRGTGG